MREISLFCDINYRVCDVDPRIFGSFLEHMGRVIYTGIYEPGHGNADEEGFRKDVLDKVHKMGVTTVRYPGGNFVSNYFWENGVGPKEKRPKKLDLAWKAIETNQFGTDEFIHWCKKADVSPIFTVNLGTRGIQDAINYIEYCNFSEGSEYSDLRKEHGIEKPYQIKTWCLGNEMDGNWQIGHKSAYEYGTLAAEAGKAMKIIDPTIELIVCGSSLSNMSTYPDWDLQVLEQTYDVIDYLALHQYYGGQDKGTKEFLAQTKDMQEYIDTIRSVVQVVKKKKRSDKDIKLSLDEWGVWASSGKTVNKEIDEKPWETAATISEQIYTMEDTLLFAGMMTVILKNADMIKIACQSLLTNVSACIMTQKNGESWVQPIYYVFEAFAKHGNGIVLSDVKMGAEYQSEALGNVSYLDQVMVYHEDEREITLFAVYKGEEDLLNLQLEFGTFKPGKMIEHMVLTAEDKKMTNEENHFAIVPCSGEFVEEQNGKWNIRMEPLSFHVIRFSV